MLLVVIFAFIAGIITILSPCILPILPIILSSTVGTNQVNRRRPVGVIMGFILSFTFFTLALSTIVKAIGIPADTLRLFSIVVLVVFGLTLLSPKAQLIIEQLFAKLSSRVPANRNKTGITGGFVVGLSLGLLWTPCVGPILASVISLAISGTLNFAAVLITLAYAMGTAIPMFAIMLGGQKLLHSVPWLLNNSAKIQKLFGVLMILTAVGIFLNVDRSFQTFILNKFPNYGIGLTQIEDNQLVNDALQQLYPGKVNEDRGKPMFDLLNQKGIPAPEIIVGGVWFNSSPLLLKDLKGKVVLIDFWTYSCINCQRTFPYLKSWHEKYSDDGLVIIGVHSPEFEFEKSADNLRTALSDFQITYPVMQDNDFATWRAYDNRYWPAKYFIDKEGFIRWVHFGEGKYDESEKMIQQLLSEGGTSIDESINNPQYFVDAKTAETYLGYQRMERIASPEQIVRDKPFLYSVPNSIKPNFFALGGVWTVGKEHSKPEKGSYLKLQFDAKEVFLVMRPVDKNKSSQLKVLLDNKEIEVVNVTKDNLYQLIKLPVAGAHTLKLEFLDNNIEIYAFTFG